MTFSCYGSSCFLSKIQFGQSETVYPVRTSKHEQGNLAKLEASRSHLDRDAVDRRGRSTSVRGGLARQKDFAVRRGAGTDLPRRTARRS